MSDVEVHEIDPQHGNPYDDLFGGRIPVLWYPHYDDSDAVNKDDVKGWRDQPRRLVLGQPGMLHQKVEDLHNEQVGPQPTDPFRGAIEEGKLHWFGYMEPSGRDHAHNEIQQRFPDIKLPTGKDRMGFDLYDDGDWKFSARSGPQVVPVDHPVGSGAWENNRSPLIYEEADDHDPFDEETEGRGTIYVGQPGAHHFELRKAVPELQMKDPWRVSGFYDPTEEKISWFSFVHPDVHEAACDHFGVSIVPEFQKFLASTGHDLQWEPGVPGKGWVLSDGSVWTWPVDGLGRPFHMEKNKVMKAQGLEPMKVMEDGRFIRPGSFYIHSDGSLHMMNQKLAPQVEEAAKAADSRLKGQEVWDF